MRDASSERWTAGADVFVRGRRWTVLSDSDFADCRALRLTGSDPLNPSIVRTLLLPFDRPRAIDSAPVSVVRPRRWLRLLQRAAVDARPFAGLFPAAGSRIDLHSYQLEPALAMRRAGHTRILIADAVGLGKTIQAGLIAGQLSIEQESFRALIVVPASLREQWAGELKARFDLHANVVTTPWLAHATRELPADISPWALPGAYICSFEFLRQPEVLRPVEDTAWDLLIVDEAHAATIGSARRSAVHRVALRSRRVVLLTATPHAGDDDQFRSLCNIGRSDERPDRIVLFQRTRNDVGLRVRRRTSLLSVTLSEGERRTHRLLEQYASNLCSESRARGDAHTRLLAIVLRKRALSSVSALAVSCSKRLALLETPGQPPPAEQLSLPLDDDEVLRDDEAPDSILSATGLADISGERQWLEAILEAARHAAIRESKVERLKRLLARIREPVIVFTEYRDTLLRLCDQLHSSHQPIAILHGGMTTDERATAQQQFNREGSLLLATDAACEGLNLQHRCRIVIHFEWPWSPARLEQRTGRVDRIGQKRRVHEIMLVAADTAERLVLVPLAKRAARARARMPSDARLFDRLSESHVASAILEGTPVDLAPPPIDAETIGPPAGSAQTARAEAMRIAQLRQWVPHAARESPGSHGIPVVAIRSRGEVLQPGVAKVYMLTLAAESGAVIHTELVAVLERQNSSRLKTPDDVRLATRTLNLTGHEIPQALLRLFDEHIEEVSACCARVGASLSEREKAVAAPLTSSAQQLVQRGLFERRSESESDNRTQARAATIDDAIQRAHALDGWSRTTARLRLYAVLLISGPAAS